MNIQTQNLECKLEDYIAELERISDRINTSGFPFPDTAMIYPEVAERLRGLLTA